MVGGDQHFVEVNQDKIGIPHSESIALCLGHFVCEYLRGYLVKM